MTRNRAANYAKYANGNSAIHESRMASPAATGRIGVRAAGKTKTNEQKEEEAFPKFNLSLH
jgi:hypothetical protein